MWHKKLEKQGLQDLATSEKKKMIKEKQDANKIELAKVNVFSRLSYYFFCYKLHVCAGVHDC